MIRFHLDEHVPHAVAHGLRSRGVDVTTTVDVNLEGADDLGQLDFASKNERVLVSHDEDFLRFGDKEHWGIAYCHQDKYTFGQLIEMIFLLHHCFTPNDMRNRVEFL